MTSFADKTKTALHAAAVLFIGFVVSGCPTKRDIEELKSRISKLESQNRESQRLVVRMDSIITAGAEASQALRGETRYSMDEMSQQIAQLLENYNALLVAIEKMSRTQTVRLSPRSSPGAQRDSLPAGVDTAVTSTVKQAVAHDCDSIYDESFLLTRQSEYQKAIDGFVNYMESCPEHLNVENARYWTGECYFALQKYPQAISEFDLLLREYPASINAGRAMYKLARSQQELGNIEEAQKLYTKLADEQPNTLEGQQAKERLKELN